ncbi:MAG: hypothetical protein KJZ64_07675 [Sphingomonadaceae bacterium]|nr:hypothetical protein [Sphingomonadaceae bacterium]
MAEMCAALAMLAGVMLGWGALAQAESDPRAPYLELQRRDQILFEAGWRLATGNALFCDRSAPSIGALLSDALTYPEPAAARAALGLRGDIVVQAVAKGSPAAHRHLPVGAALTVLDDRDIAAAFPPTEPRWQRLAAVNTALERALARDNVVELAWDEPDGAFAFARIRAVPACAVRFEVSGIGTRAVADGNRVVFGDRFPGFDWPEDEFAAAVAHELAHNLLGHREWLDRAGRSRTNVRFTEDEADRLAPWLLANAGYDPAAAVRLMQRWGPDHDGGLLRKRTHAGWKDRAEAIADELPLVTSALAAGSGKADWRSGFRRSTGS